LRANANPRDANTYANGIGNAHSNAGRFMSSDNHAFLEPDDHAGLGLV
jgi:hypothetical protein